MKNSINIFICYSSKDFEYKEELEKHLRLLKRKFREIELLSDSQLDPGDAWREELRGKLAVSDLLLYLLSIDSRDSKPCNEELAIAIGQARTEVIPIYVREYDWEGDKDLAALEMIPRMGRRLLAVTDPQWGSPDPAWTEVSKAIRSKVESILEHRKAAGDNGPEGKARDGISAAGRRSETSDRDQRLRVQAGNLSLILGQLDQAISVYTNVINDRPQPDLLPRCRINRAAAYIGRAENDDLDRAIGDCDKAIKLKPDFPDAFFCRAMAYVGRTGSGDFNRAIDDFDEAIRLESDFPKAFFNRAMAYADRAESGDLDRAIDDFDETIRLKPDFPKAFYSRALAYVARAGSGDFDRAVDDFDKAIRLEPNSPEGFFYRATAYFSRAESDDLDKAIGDFDKVIRLKPDFPEVFFHRAAAYFSRAKSGDLDRAIGDFDEAIRLESNFPKVFFCRATTYVSRAKSGDLNKAIGDFDTAIRLEPDFPEAFFGRAKAYAKKGDHDQARADFEQALKLNPEFTEAKEQLAQLNS